MKNELITRFEDLLLQVKRDGIDELITFIRKSDFYTAPASTRFHACHPGGLLEHSLNVYDCLIEKKNDEHWKPFFTDVSDETIIIISLLHDLGKCYQYEIEMRNKKDDSGQWVKVPFYKMNDKYPMPHAAKSVAFITQFIRLSIMETACVLSHMGFSDAKENYGAIGGAFRKYKLPLALQIADLEATYLLEEEE